MPKLSDDQRAQIEEHQKFYKAAFDDYTGPCYFSISCRVCSWHSNGVNLDEASRLIHLHESMHPALAVFDAHHLPIELFSASFHDHDCEMGLCTCLCGCKEGPFCVLMFGSLCGTCMVRVGRDDKEHGYANGLTH